MSQKNKYLSGQGRNGETMLTERSSKSRAESWTSMSLQLFGIFTDRSEEKEEILNT